MNDRCKYQVCDEDDDHDPECTAWKTNRNLDGEDAPYPGMATAFEVHYGQSWTDPDWRKEAAWNYFFTAGMVASDEIHKPLAQQAADWYALYDMARKERNDAREELVRLRTLIADIKAWDVEQYMNIPHELRARMQAELTANVERNRPGGGLPPEGPVHGSVGPQRLGKEQA